MLCTKFLFCIISTYIQSHPPLFAKKINGSFHVDRKRIQVEFLLIHDGDGYIFGYSIFDFVGWSTFQNSR